MEGKVVRFKNEDFGAIPVVKDSEEVVELLFSSFL